MHVSVLPRGCEAVDVSHLHQGSDVFHLCLFIGEFVSRISQKLLNRYFDPNKKLHTLIDIPLNMSDLLFFHQGP